MVVARGPTEALEVSDRLKAAEPETSVTISDDNGNVIEPSVLRTLIQKRQ